MDTLSRVRQTTPSQWGRAVCGYRPGYSARGRDRILRGVFHREPGEGVEHPPPLSLACHRRRLSMRAVDHPHLPAAPRPPPAPFRGGGQCVAIGPDTVHGDETGFRQGVHIDGRERISPGKCVDGESPPGGGADGEGGGTSPSPVAVSLVERFTLTTPTSRPLRGLLPPPSEGAGSEGRLARWPCLGTGTVSFRSVR